jgi:outer membrane protein insertion porin family
MGIATKKPGQGLNRAMLRPAIVAILLTGTAITTPLVMPAYAQSYSFSNVVVEGNERVDDATIISYLGLGKGTALSGGALNDAYQRVVNSGLFETVELVPQGSTLKVMVKEFPMVSVVDFEGNKRIKDEQLGSIIQSKSRYVYSPAQAEADAASIAEMYRVKGRLSATVEPKIIRRSDNRVDLVFEISEGKVTEVERLSFVGNRDFSDRRLRQILQTKQAGILHGLIQSDTYVPEKLELDKQLLRDFYLSRGYIDVQVLDASGDLSRERNAGFATYTIREGRSFRIGQVSVASAVEGVDAADFQRAMRMRSGITYSPSVIDNNVTRMEDLALKKGLNFIRVDPRITRNDADGTLDVQFVITRGERIFVERIDIEGNTTTLDQVIRRQFKTVEGDPFNPREIKQAAERIRALGFFKNANVDAKPGSAPDQVVVNVDVEEQPTGSLTFGASFGASAGFGLNIALAETNFLGRGQGLNIAIGTATDSVDSGITFSEPAFLGRDVKFSFSANYRTQEYDETNYNTQAISVSPSLEFPLAENSRLQLRYKVFQDRVYNVDAASSAVLVAEEAFGDPIGSSLGYTYSYDTRGKSLTPGAGLVLSYGDYTTRITDRYTGSGKIRGFERSGLGPRDLTAANQDALGGNYFAVARFEAEFPLGLPTEYGIKGGAFLDVGSVWGLDNNLGGAVDDSMHIRSAIGLSLFWETPIGPLRFNFAKPISKQDYDKEQAFALQISTQF